jgi:hypothetical protein
MNALKNILLKPLLVILILFSFWSLLIYFNASENFIKISIIASLIIILVSLGLIGFQKKWIKLIFTLSLYIVLFSVGTLFFAFWTIFDPETNSEIGDAVFYKQEIKRRTGVDVPNNFALTAKIDTIRYMGMEGEYDAECLYYAPSNSIRSFEKKIKSNPNFKEHEMSEAFDSTSVRLNYKELDFKSFSKWYVYQEDGRFTITIAFKKDAIFYDAFYY